MEEIEIDQESIWEKKHDTVSREVTIFDENVQK